jgi:hypothetical protein
VSVCVSVCVSVWRVCVCVCVWRGWGAWLFGESGSLHSCFGGGDWVWGGRGREGAGCRRAKGAARERRSSARVKRERRPAERPPARPRDARPRPPPPFAQATRLAEAMARVREREGAKREALLAQVDRLLPRDLLAAAGLLREAPNGPARRRQWPGGGGSGRVGGRRRVGSGAMLT